MTNQWKDKFKNEFSIILAAGDSKSSSLEAIEKAKINDFESARNYLEKARKEMVEAHQIEKDLIVDEVNNNGEVYGVLMMHAQDHLMNSIVFLEMAEQIIFIYEQFYLINQKLLKLSID